ncbi:hypothetical protein H4R18_000411 [Coemansia javaensis]|uniref:Aminotransferase class I/classII large domain-containing protein n=1 Tax=Coemansia javaensis TaxID=2761396 RepID=A0A9W8HLF0_9FUNG|nr:hypothetical protein H4R18_000411 [Coemansia javaensis]
MAPPELSAGALEAADKLPLVYRAMRWMVGNPYNKDTNPSGVINAGIAVNATVHPLLLERLNSLGSEFVACDLEYGIPYGSHELRAEIAHTTNRHFSPAEPVAPADIVVTNGCTAAIEMLAFAMCDPGDHVLIPAPCYLALKSDMGMRAQAAVTAVPLPLEDAMDERQIPHFERALADIEAAGKRARMLFLMSPHSPLGTVYPRRVLQALLRFASSHGLYVAVDEIYALSEFGRPADDGDSDDAARFESVLSWPDLDSFIDPASVVVLHGLSKDFGLNGLRVGWIMSPWNKDIVRVLHAYSPFGYRPAFTDRLATRLLADHEYIDTLLQISQARLASNYALASRFLDEHAIRYIPCTAGHFVWLHLPLAACTNALRALGRLAPSAAGPTAWTEEGEVLVWEHMVKDVGIYMPPGQSFSSTEPGWFRFTFSIDAGELEVALGRLLRLCTPPE